MFLIIAVGYLIGKIRLGSFSLGVVAVLFAGLGISAYDPKLALPQLVYTFGLVLFVYTIGISSGPSFFAAFRKKGPRNNGFAVGVLASGALATIWASSVFHIETGLAVGMYTGAFTNTPALASVLDTLGAESVAPVVGYSLAYPLGVLCVLAVLTFFQKVWRIDYERAADSTFNDNELYARTVLVTLKEPYRVDQLATASGSRVVVSRLSVNDRIQLAEPGDILKEGSLVTVVGTTNELDKATVWLGRMVESEPQFDHEALHTRRVFVSNRNLAGRRLRSLNLQEARGVVVTRVRRGDIDFVAQPDTVLDLGDRIKLVGPFKRVQEAASYFGDSYRLSSEFDILTFAVGIGIGLLVGLVPVPLPGGSVFHLGAAGGTLLVALVLGARGRTGKLVWQLPFSTNMALRQIGLVLFLAGIGSQAGGSLRKALSDPTSLTVIGVGAGLTIFVSVVTLVVGYKVLNIPFAYLSGMLASVQTQPAVLAFVNERTKNDTANVSYANIYPVAMITKIILAQVVLLVLK